MGCISFLEEDREELVETLVEVLGVSGAWIVGFEEFLGTIGGFRSFLAGVWLEFSDDRFFILRVGDGVVEGGFEWERREVWRVV